MFLIPGHFHYKHNVSFQCVLNEQNRIISHRNLELLREKCVE